MTKFAVILAHLRRPWATSTTLADVPRDSIFFLYGRPWRMQTFTRHGAADGNAWFSVIDSSGAYRDLLERESTPVTLLR